MKSPNTAPKLPDWLSIRPLALYPEQTVSLTPVNFLLPQALSFCCGQLSSSCGGNRLKAKIFALFFSFVVHFVQR